MERQFIPLLFNDIFCVHKQNAIENAPSAKSVLFHKEGHKTQPSQNSCEAQYQMSGINNSVGIQEWEKSLWLGMARENFLEKLRLS